jgi:hypothetical protein
MADVGTRIVDGIADAITDIPFIAAAGAFCGYIFAKSAHVPAGQAAIAWAVWFVVENAMLSIARIFTEHQMAKKMIKVSLYSITSAVGIHELQKRNLIGGKSKMILIIARCLIILAIFFSKDSKNHNDALPQA